MGVRVYLVRHGEAAGETADPSRALTGNGREGVERVGAFLRAAGVRVDAVLHSGKLRAEQTAEILSRYIDSRQGIREVKGLKPGDSVDPWVSRLATEPDHLMLAGHLPFMNDLASALLAGPAGAVAIAIDPGTCLCLERARDGTWYLACMITPRVLMD